MCKSHSVISGFILEYCSLSRLVTPPRKAALGYPESATTSTTADAPLSTQNGSLERWEGTGTLARWEHWSTSDRPCPVGGELATGGDPSEASRGAKASALHVAIVLCSGVSQGPVGSARHETISTEKFNCAAMRACHGWTELQRSSDVDVDDNADNDDENADNDTPHTTAPASPAPTLTTINSNRRMQRRLRDVHSWWHPHPPPLHVPQDS